MSGQLAAETMGTSLHRGCKANSRGSFMEMRAPEHKPLEISQEYLLQRLQNCLKPLCNVNARYVEVNCSGRARSTCEASNGKSTENIRPLGPPGATARHLTQEAAKCRGKFLTGQNVERLHRLLIAFRERVESTTQSDQSGILISTSHSLLSGTHTGLTVFKAPGCISRRFLPLCEHA